MSKWVKFNLLNLNSKQRSVTNLYLLTVDFAFDIDPVQKSAEIGGEKNPEQAAEEKIVGILPTQYNNDV